jgi:UDP-N-acetylmuramate dehydrogenase
MIQMDKDLTQFGTILYNEPLSHYNTWRVGGPAKRLFKPHDISGLQGFLKALPADEPVLWLGLGSNSLISDQGFNGTVILTQGCLKQITCIDDDKVRVEAGVSCAQLARFCSRHGLVDGEFWAGIPGTFGGALRMNAGCYQRETWEYVTQVETMNRFGEIRIRMPQEFKIGYRSTQGLNENNEWFIAGVCQLPKGDAEQSLQKIKELLARRAATQPTGEYNCGSVFRNPPGDYAARLIESCGLKGKRIGGAQISSKHANFIINEHAEAKAQDICQLIALVQETVKNKYDIHLVQEVHQIGDK